MTTIFLMRWIGEEPEAAFLRTVTGADVFSEIAKVKEVAGDLLRLDDDEVQIRSPIFAEYVVQELIDPDDILSCIYDIVAAAAQRKRERRYRIILSELMQFSNLNRLLRSDSSRYQRIGALYERFRHHSQINEYPLFWLQYAILMIERDELIPAEEFISTAYTRAGTDPSFKTYQIDTQACRLLLLAEARDIRSAALQRFNDLRDKLEIICSMLSDESHRYHAVRVLDLVEPFVVARLSAFSKGERNVLVYLLSRLAEALRVLPQNVRAQTASDEIMAGIVRAKDRIVLM